VADHLYAGKRFDRENKEANLDFESQALHAFSIEFKDLDGQQMKIEAEIPEAFKEALLKI
jgi:23S rRNA-/tRNA-specific pseudouridylate synthase